MEVKFITPVSMWCSLQEFNLHLRRPLQDMGYNFANVEDWPEDDSQVPIATNVFAIQGQVGPIPRANISNHGRIFLENFCPTTFLALAAMTDVKYGIKGEWWVNICHSQSFTMGKLYGAAGPINDCGAFKNDRGERDGHCLNPLEFFQKATEKEIIEAFNPTQGSTLTQIKMKQVFKVTRSQMVEIYTMACSEWKKVIDQKIIDLRLHIHDDAELDGEFVNQMFRAATQSQKKVLLDIFPSYPTIQNPIHDRFVTQRTLISRTVREMSQLLFNDSASIQIADGWADSVGKPELRGKSIGFSTINFDVNLHKEGGNVAVLEFIPKTE